LSDLRVPALVLDTNIVLDWLVFDDPSARPIGAALLAGRFRWVATRAMREELEHVLTRARFEPWSADDRRVLSVWDKQCELVAPGLAPLSLGLRCSDPDDQKFLELALEIRASALLSRDRALLKLAGKAARRHGLVIQTGSAWVASVGGEGN
jgi:predicted nucleic acid-binding protein